MENAKRPNLNEVVTVMPPNPYASVETGPKYPGGAAKLSVSSLASVGNYETTPAKTRQPSQLAMAGSLNILSTKGGSGAPSLAKQNDEERLKKVMRNMEKEKSLQFR